MAALIFSETSALSPSILWQINVSQRFNEFLAFSFLSKYSCLFFNRRRRSNVSNQSTIWYFTTFKFQCHNLFFYSHHGVLILAYLQNAQYFGMYYKHLFFFRFLRTKFNYLKSNMELWWPQTSRYPLVLFVTSLFTITKPPIVLWPTVVHLSM